MEDESDIVVAYTDGSCSWKDKSGGWAFRATLGIRTLTRYGFAIEATVNSMELTAILNVLEFIVFTPRTLIIYTDSRYAQGVCREWWRQWMRNGWTTATGAPVANLSLVMRISELIEQHQEHRRIYFRWTKGHAGNIENEHVDKLASIARRERKSNWTGGNH